MGSYENIIKIEEMRKYMEDGDSKAAQKVLDTMELKKIKNMSDLSLIAEVYVENEKFEEAMQLYQKIYEKTKSRKSLYQLVELNIKLNNTEEAQQYLKEYQKLAPRDFYNDIFRYRIDKLREAPYSTLIETLETLKKTEYIEKWAYELAKTYYKAGMEKECVRECADIILWFGEGVYVEKAKMLKSYFSGDADKSKIMEELKRRGADDTRDISGLFTDRKITGEVDKKASVKEEKSEFGEMSESREKSEFKEKSESGEKSEFRETVEHNGDGKASEAALEEEIDNHAVFTVDDDITQIEDVLKMDIRSMMTEEWKEDSETDSIENEEETNFDEISSEETKSEEFMPEETSSDEMKSEASMTEATRAEASSIEEAIPDVTKANDANSEETKPEATKAEVSSSEGIKPEESESEVAVAQGLKSDVKIELNAERESAEQEVEHALYQLLQEEDMDEDDRKLDSLAEALGLDMDEIFGNFLHVKTVKKQLVKSLEGILDEHTKTVQVLITGTTGSGKTTLAKDITLFLNKCGKLNSSRIAKIKAEKLNTIDILTKKESLRDCCLVVENASELNRQTIDSLLALCNELKSNIAVIFEENKKNINKLFRECPKLMDIFKNRIHLPEYTQEDLMGFAYACLRQQDYRLHQKAESILRNKVMEISKNAEPHRLLEQIYQQMQSAMDTADIRTGRQLSSLASQGKLKDVEVLTVLPEDLNHAE